ncbi:hypothetical protein L228DRAFT_279864 [Xylona heveae TC161]|uniref:Squalene/phytoene synthase n=1 Tax=Xylona heveae (strain CBS 132557 / TC161) TaxID=1328760 RepID=A0A165JVU7_XYLHT|nr:hypothetical protein L228DRAFT_279864 [Xylona heveae TC161]KZF26693.1 hypothetical protein L228DRAFT_279864 [Xylona heveae TC161]
MYSTRASIRLSRRLCKQYDTVHSVKTPFRRISSNGADASHTSTPSESEVTSARAYCLNLLQTYDAPSYTLQTFIPTSARDAYLAIRAFNTSIAQIPDTVTNATVGAMRMEFWRQTISSTFAGRPPKEPVAILLSHALSTLSSHSQSLSSSSSSSSFSSMPKSWFLRIISAREQYLNNAPYPSLDALESYAESTYSTLLYLTLSALPLSSLTADHIASHIGKASGIVAVLRGLPLLAFPSPAPHHSNRSGLGLGLGASGLESTRQGAVTLPLDIMAEAGVKEEEVFRRGADAPGLRDAVFAVATRANDHLITARQMLKNVFAGQDVGHEFEHAAEQLEHRDYPSHYSSSPLSPSPSPPPSRTQNRPPEAYDSADDPSGGGYDLSRETYSSFTSYDTPTPSTSTPTSSGSSPFGTAPAQTRQDSLSPSLSSGITAQKEYQQHQHQHNIQLEEVERAFGVYMPAVATSLWLEKLEKLDFDVFRPELRGREWKLPWKAYWAFTRRRI